MIIIKCHDSGAIKAVYIKMKNKRNLLIFCTFLINSCLGCFIRLDTDGLTEYVHVTEIDEQDPLFMEELDSEFYFQQYEGSGNAHFKFGILVGTLDLHIER